ncbi:MAG TPA: ATP-binding protein [Clostridia bacterium]|nr:ATP-binding protein [Clostridia bacterium]
MKQLLILSGKGGTGKTTLADAFIRLSRAEAYADCDVDAPNLHLIVQHSAEAERADYYGLTKSSINAQLCAGCGLCMKNCRFDAILGGAGYKVDYYACEGCGVCEAVCPTGAISLKPAIAGGLMLYKGGSIFSTAELKMGSGTSGLLVTEVKKRMKAAASGVDLAIIDGSPGIGCPVIASLSGADMVLVVAEPSVSGISDMLRIIVSAQSFRIKTAVCVNKFDTNVENTEKIEAFCKDADIPFVGRIPFDPAAVRAINNSRSIIDMDCIAAKAAKEVFSNTIKILNM